MQHCSSSIRPKKLASLAAVLVIVASCSTLAMAANVTKVEIHGVVFDEKSSTYNTTLQWDAQNFTGFWYTSGSGKSSETLKIDQSASSLTASSRVIQQENLQYNTSRTDQKFSIFSNTGKKVENGLEYNSTTGTFTKNITGGWYARLGWFGDLYVVVNGKANKLAKLLINHGTDVKEKKTLTIGETWSLGEGYNLTAQAIDAKASPRQAHLIFSKDGNKLDDKIVTEGQVYTYVEKSLAGESDVPVLATYAESIFAGTTSDIVQLRYTWLISRNVLEVKVGDQFGVFEVKEANENYVLLYNKDKPISLDQNSVQPLYGDLKFKVADSSTALRFYPIIEKTNLGKYELRGGAYDQSKYKGLVWDAQRFPGFWYTLGSGKSSENLAVDQSASSLTNASRTIEKENLQYNTSRTDQKFSIFSNTGKKVENGLEYNSTTGTFTKNITGGWYARLGWFGDLYVAVNGKANKLAKLLINHGTDVKEKKTLTIGETWSLGEGYNLTAQAIDAKASPRQAHLIFSKDGNKLDDKIVTEGQVYTYVEKSLAGESDVPVLATYAESIFAGTTSDIVQLRYTWFISQNVLEIKAGDKLGVFEVKEANENYVLLYNKDKISLDQNTVQPLYGELKFKVADSSTALRFYPVFEHTILAASQAESKTSNSTTNATPTITSTAVAPASTPVQVAAPTAVRTTPVKTTPTNIPVPKQPRFEALYVIAGIVIVAIIIGSNKR